DHLNSGQDLLNAIKDSYDQKTIKAVIDGFRVYQWPSKPENHATIDEKTGLNWGLKSLFVSTNPDDRGLYAICDTFAGRYTASNPGCNVVYAWDHARTGDDPMMGSLGATLEIQYPKKFLKQSRYLTLAVSRYVYGMSLND
ncbi:MAG: hypothetical protein INR65_10165, partial [Gluconacetobacter diazotrophicus]|nr:hypothetical protein [Gluconacetobacter diazotrophicus]